jgi:hypothetical protein
VQKEIFRSKVKGQGHNGRSKFKFWQSITLSITKIETCNLHQNVQNHFLYDKKIISCHVISVNYCVILHNMKNLISNSHISLISQDMTSRFSQILDNIVIYHYKKKCQCHTSVHVMRWNWHIIINITMLSAVRHITLYGMTFKYNLHHLHQFYCHILHNLSHIAI